MSAVLIEAEGLTKVYGKGSEGFTAVDGIDFQVLRGEAFGVLGPNGAGKSSTMRMIACVSPVTAGSLRILGHDQRHGRRRDPGEARRRAPGRHDRHAS